MSLPEGIEAFEESEKEIYKSEIDFADEWVWQFAESKEQAIIQHESKHDEWDNDMQSGKEEKITY